MKLAYFSGCKIPFYQQDYDLSFKAVMTKLEVELVELPFNCCGNPARNENFEISMLSAVKNLAMAQDQGLDIITPCKCCFGQFRHAMHWYAAQPELKQKIDNHLAQENLSWDNKIKVSHLLSFIANDIGFEAFKRKITRKLTNRKLVVQYGCHALRPFSITGFDNPIEPRLFEQVLSHTGAEILDWSKRTECCGHPIFELQPELSVKILNQKQTAAKGAGAQFICTACTHCQMQYELAEPKNGDADHLPAVLLTQVIGAAMGIDEKEMSETGKLPIGLF